MAYCTGCGSELPDGARFCPKCGAAAAGSEAPALSPQPSPTPIPSPLATGGGSSATRFVLPAIIVVALVVIALVFFTQRDGARPIADGTTATETAGEPSTRTGSEPVAERPRATVPAASTRTSAAVLDSAFNADPQGAAERYPGPVRVTGVIATMVMPGREPSLSLEGRTRFNFMIVNFPMGYRERLASLSKGQTITVDCGTVRSLGGTTILDGCALD